MRVWSESTAKNAADKGVQVPNFARSGEDYTLGIMAKSRCLEGVTCLLLEGDVWYTYSILEDLSKEGACVHIAAPTRFAPSGWSRLAASFSVYPDPLQDQHLFLDWLWDLLRKKKIDVVIPVSDRTTIPISSQKDRFIELTGMALASSMSVQVFADKGATLELARNLGVPTPKTWQVDEITQDLVDDLPYPVVVKPRRSIDWSTNPAREKRVGYAANQEELSRLWSSSHVGTVPPLIQGYVPGYGVGVFAMCNHGEILLNFGHRRVLSNPPTGGASVLRVGVEPDARALGYAQSLLKANNWTGPAMVEFRVDERDGSYRLMEVNGRFWGSLPLAVNSGFHFPCADVLIAMNMFDSSSSSPANLAGTWGTVGVNLTGLLIHLVYCVTKKDQPVGLKYHSTCEALKLLRRNVRGRKLRTDLTRLTDPMPQLVDLAKLFCRKR